MKTWSIPEKLSALMAMPWSVAVRDEDGELVAEVEELPAVIATGSTDADLGKDLYRAIEAVLEAMLVHDDPITLPAGRQAPWLLPGDGVERSRVEVELDHAVSETIRARSHAAQESFTKAFA